MSKAFRMKKKYAMNVVVANYNSIHRAHKRVGMTWACLSVRGSCALCNEQVVMHRCRDAEFNGDVPDLI